jgi:hypothetical protein
LSKGACLIRTGRPPGGIASYYWGSAPPPQAKPAEPPPSASLRSGTLAAPSSPGGLGYTSKYYPRPTRLGLHPHFTITPCARPSVPGVSAQLLGLSTPSTGKACGASPLTPAFRRYPRQVQKRACIIPGYRVRVGQDDGGEAVTDCLMMMHEEKVLADSCSRCNVAAGLRKCHGSLRK